MKNPTTTAIIALVLVLSMGPVGAAQVSKEELKSISTPDKVETWLGELNQKIADITATVKAPLVGLAFEFAANGSGFVSPER